MRIALEVITSYSMVCELRGSGSIGCSQIPFYPCVSKPVDSSGVVVFVILNHMRTSGIRTLQLLKSRGRGVIIEEYMQGPEVSCEAIVVDKLRI